MSRIFFFFFFLSVLILSCNKGKGLEIELLNKEIITYEYKSGKDTIDIINYKIVNNSNKIYYINNIIDNAKLTHKSGYKEGKNIRIFNSKDNKEVNYIIIPPYHPHYSTIEDSVYHKIITKPIILNSKRLGYKEVKRFILSRGGYTNFFIHPKETLYFEYCINLTDTITNDDFRTGYADLKKGNKYFANISIASDSSNYKTVLPRDVLKTIKANNVKVYHGIIESKNRVPVKVIE